MTNPVFERLLHRFEIMDTDYPSQVVSQTIGYFKRPSTFEADLSTIQEIFYNPQNTVTIRKTEDIMHSITKGASFLIKLKDQEYLTQQGCLFKDPLNPKKRNLIILSYWLLVSDTQSLRKCVMFDQSVLTEQEEPVSRFILRKLIPGMTETDILFGFADLSVYLLQPSPPVSTDAFDDIRSDIAQMCYEYLRV